MSSHTKPANQPPLDLSKWRPVPTLMIVVGGALALLGFFLKREQFAASWLLAFMFCLSICLGALFLVLMHHLFDAGWSVPIRRFCEHIASLIFPYLALFFIPIALLGKYLYSWMSVKPLDESVAAKQPLFTMTGFYLVAVGVFGVWWLLTNRLRYWSLKQDETGGSLPTYKMRSYSYWGIFAFAVTLTLGAIMWMKAMQYHWFSTMYGVYYFAGCVWTMLALVYVITMILTRQGILTSVLHEHQFYYIGSLLFAFTVFYAYIHFAQYFIIWNGNIPEETFWYVIREQGSWFAIGMIIIFGHFFVPFLALLRIDVKNIFPFMTALGAWVWLMQYFDIAFNVHPVQHPNGFPWQWIWLDFACIAFMLGILTKAFLAKFAASAPYPIKDPRLAEAMGHFHPVPTQISGGELDQTDDLPDAPEHGHGK
jgi:hypothetical protein